MHNCHTGCSSVLTGLDRNVCPLKAQVIIKRGQKVDGPEGPIIVATRNNDLQGVVDATPPERREGQCELCHDQMLCQATPACYNLLQPMQTVVACCQL